MNATLHLLIGPVGAGKTRYAQRRILEYPALFLNLDEWMVRLYGDDQRPDEGVMAWYLERRERCRALVWRVALDALSAGLDVVLEFGLLRASERQAFYATVDAHEVEMVVYLIDAPRDERRERVTRRNVEQGPTFSQHVPLAFFEVASDAWEEPGAEERGLRGMVVV